MTIASTENSNASTENSKRLFRIFTGFVTGTLFMLGIAYLASHIRPSVNLDYYGKVPVTVDHAGVTYDCVPREYVGRDITFDGPTFPRDLTVEYLNNMRGEYLNRRSKLDGARSRVDRVIDKCNARLLAHKAVIDSATVELKEKELQETAKTQLESTLKDEVERRKRLFEQKKSEALKRWGKAKRELDEADLEMKVFKSIETGDTNVEE